MQTIPSSATSTRQLSPAQVQGLDLWNAVMLLIENPKIRSASRYVSPRLVVTATRRGKHDGRDRHLEMVVTIGVPNYRGRQFVKACLKAGEPFPVRKPQVKWMKMKRTKRVYHSV